MASQGDDRVQRASVTVVVQLRGPAHTRRFTDVEEQYKAVMLNGLRKNLLKLTEMDDEKLTAMCVWEDFIDG